MTLFNGSTCLFRVGPRSKYNIHIWDIIRLRGWHVQRHKLALRRNGGMVIDQRDPEGGGGGGYVRMLDTIHGFELIEPLDTDAAFPSVPRVHFLDITSRLESRESR